MQTCASVHGMRWTHTRTSRTATFIGSYNTYLIILRYCVSLRQSTKVTEYKVHNHLNALQFTRAYIAINQLCLAQILCTYLQNLNEFELSSYMR